MIKTVWISGQTSENMSGDDQLKRILNALDAQRNTEVVRIRNSQRVLLRRFEVKLRRSASTELENSRLKSSSRVNSLTRKDEGGTKVDHSNSDNCKELQGNIPPIQTIAQGNAKGSKAQSNSIWNHPVDNDKNTTKPSKHLGVNTNKEIQEIISPNEAIDQTNAEISTSILNSTDYYSTDTNIEVTSFEHSTADNCIVAERNTSQKDAIDRGRSVIYDLKAEQKTLATNWNNTGLKTKDGIYDAYRKVDPIDNTNVLPDEAVFDEYKNISYNSWRRSRNSRKESTEYEDSDENGINFRSKLDSTISRDQGNTPSTIECISSPEYEGLLDQNDIAILMDEENKLSTLSIPGTETRKKGKQNILHNDVRPGSPKVASTCIFEETKQNASVKHGLQDKFQLLRQRRKTAPSRIRREAASSVTVESKQLMHFESKKSMYKFDEFASEIRVHHQKKDRKRSNESRLSRLREMRRIEVGMERKAVDIFFEKVQNLTSRHECKNGLDFSSLYGKAAIESANKVSGHEPPWCVGKRDPRNAKLVAVSPYQLWY